MQGTFFFFRWSVIVVVIKSLLLAYLHSGKCEEKNTGFIAMKPFGGEMLDDASACVRFLMQYGGCGG